MKVEPGLVSIIERFASFIYDECRICGLLELLHLTDDIWLQPVKATEEPACPSISTHQLLDLLDLIERSTVNKLPITTVGSLMRHAASFYGIELNISLDCSNWRPPARELALGIAQALHLDYARR
ncbi:hypothetical protein [Streptomyces sp. NPDC058086]|uniref:hypothetical protein n=1 Tax=Streptomyces sp. NPDC058086 TaxID=3346334 RepID=UPI0036E8EF91